jgi:hypothetical protein
MPTANYDASLLTQRRRNLVLYSWNKANNAAVTAGTSIRREQPNMQLQTVVTYRQQTLANNTSDAGCQCDSPTNSNTGGDNSQNWG